jgi:hypothetical protein
VQLPGQHTRVASQPETSAGRVGCGSSIAASMPVSPRQHGAADRPRYGCLQHMIQAGRLQIRRSCPSPVRPHMLSTSGTAKANRLCRRMDTAVTLPHATVGPVKALRCHAFEQLPRQARPAIFNA